MHKDCHGLIWKWPVHRVGRIPVVFDRRDWMEDVGMREGDSSPEMAGNGLSATRTVISPLPLIRLVASISLAKRWSSIKIKKVGVETLYKPLVRGRALPPASIGVNICIRNQRSQHVLYNRDAHKHIQHIKTEHAP